MKEKAKQVTLLIVLIYTILLESVLTFGEPAGAALSERGSSRRQVQDPTEVNAQAGNVTALNIDHTKITAIWQGYYGNISGKITLDNADNKSFYDWTIDSARGEVYASRTTVSSWAGVTCPDETMIINEESSLGITSTWTDSINNTFSSGTSHPEFIVADTTISSGSCYEVQAYNSTGTGKFWNVLINVSDSIVYTSIIDDNQNSFDNSTADFELIVPTNYTDGGISSYYFYVELN
ncbi:hypothetical protein GF327_04565 [Candidatus Woesearchaeota archaeon]|nr:hypothetical protein [Candidatus Woesearchaeota archaeon]